LVIRGWGILLLFLSLIDDADEKTKFERIYYKYRNLMFYIAINILKNRQDAEDAVQKAFIKIARNIKQIDEIECHKTKAFVVIVVERVAINDYHKKKKEPHISYDEIPYSIPIDMNLEEIVLSNAVFTDILKGISELPVKYCDALTLKYVYGLSGKEISDIVGVSHAAVRKRIERGLEMLNTKITENE
jgi:RNA polymerase sigma-70 factor (ECF subfamily)